jgi:hypothetical protein
MSTSARSRQNLQPDIASVTACRPLDSHSGASSTGAEGDESISTRNATVDIHAVTKHTQSSEKSPSGQIKGPSAAIPVKTGRVVLWTSGEEEELKRLVSTHTDPKGSVSWVKVVDAWTSLNLHARSKASLSSKWSDIKSRTMLLDSASKQNSAVLCRTPDIGVPQQQTNVDTTHEVSRAVKSPKKKRPVADTSAPAPGKNSLNLANEGDCSKKDDIAFIFNKCLKKARRIGCQVYRKPPKRVTPGNNTQSILNIVDLLIKEEVDSKMKDAPSWNQLSVLVYARAMTVDRICNQASEEKQSRSKLWFNSTYKGIDKLCKNIGKASAELNRRKQTAEVAPMAQQLINIRLLERKYKCKTFADITSLVEKLKCRLKLLLSRIELRKADEQRLFVRRMPTKMIFRDKVSEDSPDTANINQIRQY